MNLKEIFVGTAKEKAAGETVKRLSALDSLKSRQETQLSEAKKITRRHFLRQALVVGGGTTLLAATGQILSPFVRLGEVPEQPSVTLKNKPLSDYITVDLQEYFDLKVLADKPTRSYEFTTTDKVPTSVHVYDPNLEVNTEALSVAYELANRKNISRIINALKDGKSEGRDYAENPKGSGEIYFQYRYSSSGQYSPIPVILYPFSDVVKQRVMLVVNDSDAPEWSKVAKAITRHYSKDVDAEKPIFALTVINADKLRKMNGNGIFLTAGVATEIFQQTLKAFSVANGRVAGPNSAEDIIAQEGVCNTFGNSVSMRAAGYSWADANKWLTTTTIGGIPRAPEPIKNFPINKSTYDLLPNNGLFLK